jgi:hypothetical protein
VAALLVGDSQIETGLSPLDAMWRNTPPPSTKLGENMCQLVPQSPIDFGWMLDQPWI